MKGKKQSVIWVVAGFLLLVGLGIVYLATNKAPMPPSPSVPQSESDTPPTNTPTTDTSNKPGEYTTYEESKLATTEGRKILFFHAPWCPQCRALEQSITKGKIPNGITIFKVDYDTSTALKQKYGVTLQTTVVEVDYKGDLIKKYVAYDSPTLTAVLKALGK